MSPGVRENLEPRRAILRNIGVQNGLSLQRATVTAWNEIGVSSFFLKK